MHVIKRLAPLNSWRYYLLLAFIATFFLGPLGAVMGAFMLLRLGMSVGVQVFAGDSCFGSQVSQTEPGSVTSAFGTSCL